MPRCMMCPRIWMNIQVEMTFCLLQPVILLNGSLSQSLTTCGVLNLGINLKIVILDVNVTWLYNLLLKGQMPQKNLKMLGIAKLQGSSWRTTALGSLTQLPHPSRNLRSSQRSNKMAFSRK